MEYLPNWCIETPPSKCVYDGRSNCGLSDELTMLASLRVEVWTAATGRSQIEWAAEHFADVISPEVRCRGSRINASIMFEAIRPKGCIRHYLAA